MGKSLVSCFFLRHSVYIYIYIYAYNMPTQLLYRPVLHYIQLCSFNCPRRRLWRNVKLTSQRRAVTAVALFSAAPDCRLPDDDDDFLDFSHDDIFFHQRFHSLIYNDLSHFAWYKRGFHCDVTAAILSVSWLELLCDLFLPVVQSQALEEHDTLGSTPFPI